MHIYAFYVQTNVSMYAPHIYIHTLTHTSEMGGKGRKGGKKEGGRQERIERQKTRGQRKRQT